MFYYKIYGDFLVHFRSFSKNKIFELYVLDANTGNIYVKIFLTKENVYPTLYKESASPDTNVTLNLNLYVRGNMAKIQYCVDDLVNLIMNGVTQKYNTHITTKKPVYDMMREMDIYYNKEQCMEMCFSSYTHAPMYFKLNLVNSTEIIYQNMMTYYKLAFIRKTDKDFNTMKKEIMNLKSKVLNLENKITENEYQLKKKDMKYKILQANMLDKPFIKRRYSI